jgi:3-dehydroquinate synthase
MMGDGERYKNQRTVAKLYERLFDIGVGRRDTIMALGGGVVGDTAGFTAATFKRGVQFVQVPTTLLAMVDASVGGKVGINHTRGKNQVGVFYHPAMVVIRPQYLATLGRREIMEGLAEILKVGFLSSQRMVALATGIEPAYSSATKDNFEWLIRRSVTFKARIVKRDERERDIRAILNFGHTFGHAIETAEGYRRYRHGEAVLAGMIGALHLSHAVGILGTKLMDRYLAAIEPHATHLRPLKRDINDYFSPIAVDKKNRDRTPVFVLLERIGRPIVRAVESRQKIVDAIAFMKRFIADRR